MKNALCLILIVISASESSFPNCCSTHVPLLRKITPKSPCHTPRVILAMKFNHSYHLMATSRRGAVLCCCGRTNASTNLQWYFNSFPLQLELSSFRKTSNSSIYSPHTLITDSGKYGCVDGESELNRMANVTLKVLESEPYCDLPSNCLIEPTIQHAFVRASRTFSCQGYVGEAWNEVRKTIQFYKVQQGLLIPSDTLPNTTQRIALRKDVIYGELKILYVTNNHFGNYICVINNNGKYLELPFSLVEGVSDSEFYVGKMSTILLIFAFWAVLAVSLLLIVIWKPTIPLRIKLAVVNRETELLYDIAIIHGEDTIHWVYSILLKVLEDVLQLRCYAPYKDILGGEGYADGLLQHLPKCRKVLVVLSEKLLVAEWSRFACHVAIKSYAGRKEAICCMSTKNVKLSQQASITDDILRYLNRCNTITYPYDLEGIKGPQEEELPYAVRLISSATKIHERNSYTKVDKNQGEMEDFYLKLLKFIKSEEINVHRYTGDGEIC